MSTATLKNEASKDEGDIRALVESVRKAHHSKDAAAIAAQYAPDAAVFNLAPPLSHSGIDLQEMKAWLDTWEGPVDQESRDLTITVSRDLAFCHGFLRLGGTKKGVNKPSGLWMRTTVCLHRDGGEWRIVHEHTSVPFTWMAPSGPPLTSSPSGRIATHEQMGFHQKREETMREGNSLCSK